MIGVRSDSPPSAAARSTAPAAAAGNTGVLAVASKAKNGSTNDATRARTTVSF
jgi:hypothetical protein